MTQAPSLIGLFVAPLNRAGIEYMVTGVGTLRLGDQRAKARSFKAS